MAYITTKQASEILETTPEWITVLCRKGILYAIKPGRDWQVDDGSVFDYKDRINSGEIKRRGPKFKNR